MIVKVKVRREGQALSSADANDHNRLDVDWQGGALLFFWIHAIMMLKLSTVD
jgi:hypothetical protein